MFLGRSVPMTLLTEIGTREKNACSIGSVCRTPSATALFPTNDRSAQNDACVSRTHSSIVPFFFPFFFVALLSLYSNGFCSSCQKFLIVPLRTVKFGQAYALGTICRCCIFCFLLCFSRLANKEKANSWLFAYPPAVTKRCKVMY